MMKLVLPSIFVFSFLSLLDVLCKKAPQMIFILNAITLNDQGDIRNFLF